MTDHSQTDSLLGRNQNAHCPAQIVTAAGENDLHAIAHQRVETHPPQTIVLLENGERSLYGSSDTCNHFIASLLPRRQFRMVFVGPVHQAILDASLSKTRMPRMGIIGLIAIDRFLVATDQTVSWFSIGNRSIGNIHASNDGVIEINADMHFVPEHGLVAFAGALGLGGPPSASRLYGCLARAGTSDASISVPRLRISCLPSSW